jgi:hypothetical protein
MTTEIVPADLKILKFKGYVETQECIRSQVRWCTTAILRVTESIVFATSASLESLAGDYPGHSEVSYQAKHYLQ